VALTFAIAALAGYSHFGHLAPTYLKFGRTYLKKLCGRSQRTASSNFTRKKGVIQFTNRTCSFAVDFFSTPRTIMLSPFTATAVVPFLTASSAYSTYKTA